MRAVKRNAVEPNPCKAVREPDSCSIRFDWGLEIFSFVQSNAGFQVLDPLLQSIALLTELLERERLPILICPGFQIVNVSLYLARKGIDFAHGGANRLRVHKPDLGMKHTLSAVLPAFSATHTSEQDGIRNLSLRAT
jgi:hypothetical protein